MSSRVLAVSVVLLVLAAMLPFVYVNWMLYVPKLADTEASHQAAILQVEASIDELQSQQPATEQKLAESRSRLGQAREENRALVRRLDASLDAETNAKRELHRTRDDETALDHQLRAIDEEIAADDAREQELRAESGSVGREVDELSGELSDLQSDLDWTMESTARLTEERQRWEEYETFHSIPRASLYGVAGWSQEGLSGGVDVGAWLFRPRGQRLGLRAGYFVHSDRKDSYGFLGAAWQRLLPRRLYLDLWAGGRWSEQKPQSEGPFDPAGGVTLGVGLPSLPIGLGVTAFVSPDETLLGFAVGYTQVAQSADLYGRR